MLLYFIINSSYFLYIYDFSVCEIKGPADFLKECLVETNMYFCVPSN